MLQQHQVGALFGLFVRAIGAARFVRAVAPVAALVAVASIPLPRAASPIDASMPSSGLVRMLTVAQRASAGAWHFAAAGERVARAPAHAGQADGFDLHAKGSHAPRIGDRFLHLRAAQRATHAGEEAAARHVGDRLLHASSSRSLDTWSSASPLAAFALPGGAVKPIASTGATPRAPPEAAAHSKDAGDPQPASANEVAHDSQQSTGRDQVVAVSGPVVTAYPTAEEKIDARETYSPLKLSAEQRNISRFVARRYRVNLDDVQRFVAHAFRAAGEFRLDPYLVLAVMSIESSFNPNARSSAGAQGLMQVLTRVHLDKFAPFGGARAALDPVANITVGSRILKEYLVREGSVEGALKSYVGAALLPHDFGYGNKVLTERARIAAAARTGVQTITTRADGATKIAMAQQAQASRMKASPVTERTEAQAKRVAAVQAPLPLPAQANGADAPSNAALAPSVSSREL